MTEKTTMAADNEVAAKELTQAAWAIMDKAEVGDMVAVFVPLEHRPGHVSAHKDMWAKSRYTIGELAEKPSAEDKKRAGTRVRGAAKIRLYLPEEKVEGEEYVFSSRDPCENSEGGLVSAEKHRCPKKHYTEVSVYLVRAGPWKKDALVINDSDSKSEPPRKKQRAIGKQQKRDEDNLIRQMLIRRGGLQQDSDEEEVLRLSPGMVQTINMVDDYYTKAYPGTLTE